MKVFFDTNVYIAEALLGRAAARMIAAAEKPNGELTPART